MTADIGAPVSVVIPCYRCRTTVGRALGSVAAQTLRPREVILIDDASDDDTIVILQDLQNLYGDDWLKVIRRQINGGPGAARNTGWDAAVQPYIAFLDADDTWHPRKIEIQLQYMQSHPEISITGHRLRWQKEGEKIDVYAPLPERYGVFPIVHWRLLTSNILLTPTVMLRRDIPFRFEPSKRYSEDYLLWLSIILAGYKGAFIDLELAYIHKAPYGAGGVSRQLWKMEKEELDNYWRLWRKKQIPLISLLGLMPFSLAKFMRRVMVSKLWK